MSGRLQTDAFSHSKSDTSGKTFRARDKVSHASYFFIFLFFLRGWVWEGEGHIFFFEGNWYFLFPQFIHFPFSLAHPPKKKNCSFTHFSPHCRILINPFHLSYSFISAPGRIKHVFIYILIILMTVCWFVFLFISLLPGVFNYLFIHSFFYSHTARIKRVFISFYPPFHPPLPHLFPPPPPLL